MPTPQRRQACRASQGIGASISVALGSLVATFVRAMLCRTSGGEGEPKRCVRIGVPGYTGKGLIGSGRSRPVGAMGAASSTMTSERGIEDKSFVMSRGGPADGMMKEKDGPLALS